MATIDLTPNSEGYAAIGATFVAQVLQDVKRSRKDADLAMLVGIIDIAFAFGHAAGSVADEERGMQLRDAMFDRVGGRPDLSQQAAQPPSRSAAINTIREMGMSASWNVGRGEFRVTFKNVHARLAEKWAYYTDDAQDAIDTARDMQSRGMKREA